MVRFLSCLAVLLFAPISISLASHHPACPDESYFTVVGGDGNRYGWFENASCVFEDTEVHRVVHRLEYPACPEGSHVTSVGGDGISYGWYQEATCIVADYVEPVSSCDLEGTVVSPVTDTSLNFNFQNNSSTSVQLHWLDFDGNRQLFHNINAGDTVSQQTFEGHPWILVDEESQECLELYASVSDGEVLSFGDGVVADPVAEPVEETIAEEILEEPASDGEFASIAGMWENIGFTILREARQISADGTYTVWNFVPVLEEYLGLGQEEIMIVLSFMDDELIAAGYSQAQIDFLREPRECWVVNKIGTITSNNFGGDTSYTIEETVIGIGMAVGSISFSREGDNLIIDGDLHVPLNDEINLCSEV